MQHLVEIQGLEIQFKLREGTVRAVDGLNLEIKPHRTLGLVGESGCGKSMAARAILRILPPRAEITAGKILLSPEDHGEPVDLVRIDPKGKEIRRIRGGEIGMIFQEPMTSLSPVHTVGDQIGECLRLHKGFSRREAGNRVVELLALAGVPLPERRAEAYPHQLSGGLRQRCMIAMALAASPRLLIADEPTTALDVTVQAQILNLLEDLQDRFGMAVLMITHDLGVIAETADEVAVMYLGRVVEEGPVKEILAHPLHPYTKGLLASAPCLGKGKSRRLESIPGSVPASFTQIQGCPFHPRCPERIDGVCDQGAVPPSVKLDGDRKIACHLHTSGI